MLTRDELVAVMPHAAGNADRVLPALDAAMQRFDITTPAREAAFLAQLAHESGELRRWTENLNYGWTGLRKTFPKYFATDVDAQAYDRKPERIANRVYGDRLGNGPEASGDGWRYRGRGPIQLTGKDNYQACGRAIGVDLVGAPERVETPEVGCLAAAWFWASRGLNALADVGDFKTITRRINGGLIGFEDRAAFWRRAKGVFGVAEVSVGTTRGLRGIAVPEEVEQPAAPARGKPAKPRATTAAKTGAKAKKARVASGKTTRAKAVKPRVTAAKKQRAKPAKAVQPRAAAAKRKAAKATVATRARAARKPARKPVAARSPARKTRAR